MSRFEHVIPMFECRRYKYFPPLKWLIWSHFKDSGTLGARIRKTGVATNGQGDGNTTNRGIYKEVVVDGMEVTVVEASGGEE